MTGDEILEQVRERWDLDPLPTPRGGWLACPVCRSDRWQIRYWRTHIRPGEHRVKHRVDVALKCTVCSGVWAHGLAIDEATFDRLRAHGEWIWWRDRHSAGAIQSS